MECCNCGASPRGSPEIFRKRQYGGYGYRYPCDSEEATEEDDNNLFDDEVEGDDVANI
jgi:hypothetical protein